MKEIVSLEVNGRIRDLLIPPHKTLLEAVREDLRLTGTKHGCELGECGACAVIVDGEPVLSCLTLTVDCAGKKIVTIEGLSEKNKPHPLQSAFAEMGAAQCGYCTSGMICALVPFLEKNPNPEDEETREAISGNLCRCTGYLAIIRAAQSAAKEMNRAG